MEVIQLVVLGLCSGSLLSLSAQGVVLIYRGSGVLNLAHASMGGLAAFAYWELHDHHRLPFVVAAVGAVVVAALVGYLTHLLVIRPLRSSSTLTKLVATLAVLVIIQSALQLYYGSEQRISAPVLPTGTLEVAGIRIGADRLLLFVISAALTVVLHVIYRRTTFGIATTATAENPRAASALGLSPVKIAAINWAVGAGLAGLASVLLAPIVQVQLTTQNALIVSVLAAALMGGMKSFGLTFLGGSVIGVAQALVGRYVSAPGWSEAVPFIIIVVVMVVRGQGLTGRPQAREIRPKVGSGRIRPLAVVAAITLMVVLIQWIVTVSYVDAMTLTLCVGLILLSSVVITGYAGQLSLCQFSMAGAGAVVAGLLVSKLGFPFELALLSAILISFPLGFLVGLPALRARGINLAVATLGLAAALQGVLFLNTDYTGGDYVSVPSPSLFGLNLDNFMFPRRYALFCLFVLVVGALAVANLRRGRSGRRLIAMRSNERAAAAAGVNVFGAKLYSFALAASIAAAGGILLTFRQSSLSFGSHFEPVQSINGTLYSVIGGIGFVMGPILGSMGQPASIVATIFHGQGDDFALWMSLILGVGTVRLVQDAPDGLIRLVLQLSGSIGRRLGIVRDAAKASSAIDLSASQTRGAAVRPQTLEVRGVSVKFGGVTALNDFSCRAEPGKILGIIGPNGAGKTTMIEAITGYVQPSSGTVSLDGESIDGMPVHRRVAHGLGRTFQSLELFDDMSVGDNLRVAADPQDLLSYATDLAHPRELRLPDAAIAAVHEFHLGDDLDKLPDDLSYGSRRLVAIARSVASGPSVLCLDEPAAGLSGHERRELAVLMRKLADDWGMAIILIEHDVDLVMGVCDEIVALEFGRTIAVGTPHEVRSNPAVIAAYLGHDDAPPVEADDPLPRTASVPEAVAQGGDR